MFYFPIKNQEHTGEKKKKKKNMLLGRCYLYALSGIVAGIL